MDNSSNSATCALHVRYSVHHPPQLSYVINSILTLILTIPAIGLNALLIFRYTNLPPKERRQNSKLLICNQAIVDLFNVFINSPLNAVVNLVYFTAWFDDIYYKREESCPYFYIMSSWTYVVSLISSLLLFILVAIDRLLAAWKPVYWQSRLKYKNRRLLKVAVVAVWIVSALFALGEVYGHGVEFFSENKSKVHATNFHHARMVACLVLTAILLTIWSLTFLKIRYDLQRGQKLMPGNSSGIITNSNVSSSDSDSEASGPSATASASVTFARSVSSATKAKKSRSPITILNAELKLIRIYATMLLFFLLGYFPTLVYFIVRSVHPGTFTAIEKEELAIVYATSFTGLVVASCLNPILVMVRVDAFKSRTTKRKSPIHRVSKHDDTLDISVQEKPLCSDSL